MGATAHYMTEKLDEGPIITQDVVDCSHCNTVEDLVGKGGDVERIAFSRAVRSHLDNRILVYQNGTIAF